MNLHICLKSNVYVQTCHINVHVIGGVTKSLSIMLHYLLSDVKPALPPAPHSRHICQYSHALFYSQGQVI